MQISKNLFNPLGAMVCVIAGLLPAITQAEVMLDNNYPWDMGKEYMAKQGSQPIRQAAKKYTETTTHFSPDFSFSDIADTRMQLNGKVYYIAVVQYANREQEAVRPHYKDIHPVKGGGVCSLYATDANLNVVAHLDFRFPEHDGNTWCNGVHGIARVKGQDALLVPVSYYLTDDGKLAKNMRQIGDDWRWMTLVLRLKQQNGQLIVTQDDSCLGNPNPFKDIPSARKAIKNRTWCVAE